MNTIILWLEHLNVLMSPGNIALVGAGNGKGIWAQWLIHQASNSRVTFIEAEPLQYSNVQRTLDSLGERAQHCEIRNTVVAVEPGKASFFVANSQQESGLLEPSLLLSLWPNLQTEEVRELSAITLDALLSDLSEDAEQPIGERNWLVIDCLPAGALLRASSKLDLVDVVIARVLLGEMHAMPDGTSLEEVAEFLRQKGMLQIAVEATRHPGIGYALFVRDTRAALHLHHSECQRLRLNCEEQTKLLQEFQSQVRQLTQTKAAAEKLSQELAQQLEQLTQAKLILEAQSQERQLQIEQLKLISTALKKNEFQQQLESSLGERIGKALACQIDACVKAQTEAFSKLLQSNLSETKESLQWVVNASEAKFKNELGKGLANSVKQLESFMNIQSFFSSGDFFSDFHGWPISPDIGVFLLEKMRSRNYDLIIEFGSGTSTVLFAKAVEVMSGKTQKSVLPKVLKTEILTFEHNQHYHEQTGRMLQMRKLAGYVNLVHAPLIDWKDESDAYLYYDCRSVLNGLAEKYKARKIKILVLVDGPPGATCKNARYPAIPHIFNALGKHSIDIVLDDASRSEEKATIELWRNFWKSRSIKMTELSISGEKGIYIASN